MNNLFKIMFSAREHKIGLVVLLYYTLLVIITDCLIWSQLSTIKGYHTGHLIVYSIMAYPLWIIWWRKGLVVEFSDFILSGKQSHVEVWPYSYTRVYLLNYLGKTLKMKGFLVWILMYITLLLYYDVTLWILFLGIILIIMGHVAYFLAHQILSLLAPVQYLGIYASLFSNFFWIFSGTVIPISFITNATWFYYVNPFSASIYGPLSFIFEFKNQTTVGEELHIYYHLMLSTFIWSFILFLLVPFVEKKVSLKIN